MGAFIGLNAYHGSFSNGTWEETGFNLVYKLIGITIEYRIAQNYEVQTHRRPKPIAGGGWEREVLSATCLLGVFGGI